MNGDQPVTHAQLQSELQALEVRMSARHDILRSDMQQANEVLRSDMQQANGMLRSEMQHMYDDLKVDNTRLSNRSLKGLLRIHRRHPTSIQGIGSYRSQSERATHKS